MIIKLLGNDSSNLKYTFFIEGISNTLIQKLLDFKKGDIVLASLEKLKKEYSLSSRDTLRASKYIVTSRETLEHEKNIKALEKLRVALQSSSSDTIQDLIPNVYRRNIPCEIDLKNLSKLISLRDLESSLDEEKELARLLFKALSKEDRNLLDDGEN